MSSTPHGPVVVGIDGTEESDRIADFAAHEAHRRRVPLHILVTFDSEHWAPSSILIQNRPERVWAGNVADRLREYIIDSHPDLTVIADTVEAHPAGALIEASGEASLVVVGTRAGTGILGRAGGSVAAQVAAHADAPVLVVRPGDERPEELAKLPIVVGLDGSAESEQALGYAVDTAVARGVNVRAVYAWSMLGLSDIGPFRSEFYEPDAQDKAHRLVAEAVSGWSDRYPDLDIVNRAVHVIDPVRALLHETREAGLVVLGSRGRGGFLGLRLGSTVDGVIRQARCPVVVIGGSYPVPR